MSKRTGRRRLACHHEAGHVLVRWYFGHWTDRAVVLTVDEVRAGVWPINRKGIASLDAEGVVEGYDIHSFPFWKLVDPNLIPQEVVTFQTVGREVELINCSAGIAAEAYYRKSSYDCCALAGGRGDMTHARTILKEWWGLDLLERREPTRLARLRATALVRSTAGNAAIKSMANALIDKGEIDGDEIADLCGAAYGGRQPRHGLWNDHWPPSLSDLRAGRIPDA